MSDGTTGTYAAAVWDTHYYQHRLQTDVDRVERFRLTLRFFDGVVIYFFNSDFKFFNDASEFSVTSFYVVLYFILKVHVNFSSVFYRAVV